MRRKIARVSISVMGLALTAGLVSITSAEAATGYLEIKESSAIEVINNPSGCIGSVLIPATVTVANHTNATVELYSGPGCSGVPVPLPAGESAIGTYRSVYVPK